MSHIARVLKALAACAVLFAPALATPASAETMKFRLVTLGAKACGNNCPRVIAAEGEIDEGTPEAFGAFVKANVGDKRVKNVMFIHSAGGRVVSALKLGLALRQFGTSVVVARVREGVSDDPNGQFGTARCMSACVYVLIGGKKRVIPPQSQVGIHRMFREETGKDPANESPGYRQTFASGSMVDVLSRYTGSMGVSRELILEAEKVSPESLHIVTPKEMVKWRLGSPKF